MGCYLVPELLKMGYVVDAVSKDDMRSNEHRLTYFKYNCYDDDILAEQLKKNYDGIMNYSSSVFAKRLSMFLENTAHYIFLSSYRVYANEEVLVKETSPRLIDVSKDNEFLSTPNYAIEKCRCENILYGSKYINWTIVRPVIVLAETRIPLITLETSTVLNRTAKVKRYCCRNRQKMFMLR